MIQTTFTPVTVSGEPAAVPVSGGLADYYRALLHQLRTALGMAPAVGRSLGITSCLLGEGVSTICRHLAVAAAQQMGRPVLVIDTSGKRPGGGGSLAGGGPPAGLYDVLAGKVPLVDCLRADQCRDVFLLGIGHRNAADPTRYPKEAFIELLDDLKREFPLVIVDLPTANELTDCFSICGLLDGVLMVVEAERVRSQVVARARDQLFQAGAKLLGVVFNKRKNHVPEWLYRRL
jgi:Mrp family chromosome partitioning ATPase